MTYLMDSSVKTVAEAKSTVEAIYKKIKDINYNKKDLVSEIKTCISENSAITIVHIGENQETLLILVVKENIENITKAVVRQILSFTLEAMYLSDKLGNVPLAHAAMVNNIDFLRTANRSIRFEYSKVKNKDGKTAFMLAAQHNHKEFLEKMFELEFKISKEEQEQSLLLAAERGHTAVVNFLLAKGVNVQVKDAQGFTPLQLANHHGHDEVVWLLNEFILKNSQSTHYEWRQALLTGSSYLIEKSRDALQYLANTQIPFTLPGTHLAK